MNISSINLNFTPLPQQKKHFQTNAQIYDTFEKNISFGYAPQEYSYEAFKDWATSTSFMDNAIKIINSPKRVLGSGFEGTTYEIPSNDTWVIKQYRIRQTPQQNSNEPSIEKCYDKSPSLNVGQKIAKVVIPELDNDSNVLYILKKQKGTSYGISFFDRDEITEKNIKRHISSLQTVADFPVETYKQLIMDIIEANDKGYRFDYLNPNNIMIDTEEQRINFVDVNDNNNEPETYQFGDILFALLDGAFAMIFNKSTAPQEDKDTAQILSQQIIDKYMTAMKECSVKFEETVGYLMLEKSFLNRTQTR